MCHNVCHGKTYVNMLNDLVPNDSNCRFVHFLVETQIKTPTKDMPIRYKF